LDKQAKAFLDRCFFRPCAAAPHGLSHQTIVDFNIGSHIDV